VGGVQRNVGFGCQISGWNIGFWFLPGLKRQSLDKARSGHRARTH
jgi:hypothetical protein